MATQLFNKTTGVQIYPVIDSSSIPSMAVTAVKIANGAIQSSHLSPGAVISSALDDGAVTTSKIADSAITTAKIANYAITNAKIAVNSISNEKLQNESLSDSKIVSVSYSKVTGVPTWNKRSFNSVLTSFIAEFGEHALEQLFTSTEKGFVAYCNTKPLQWKKMVDIDGNLYAMDILIYTNAGDELTNILLPSYNNGEIHYTAYTITDQASAEAVAGYLTDTYIVYHDQGEFL